MGHSFLDAYWILMKLASLENWGSNWAVTCCQKYRFGSHALRSHVITQMMLNNVNPFYLSIITGHNVPGFSKVVQGHVTPSLEEVRQVLEQME